MSSSVGAGNSHPEETGDLFCNPCRADGLENDAQHYCEECGEYICHTCKDLHRKFKATRDHTVKELQSEAKTKIDAAPEESFECDPCKEESKKTEASCFCEDCPEYLCNDCKSQHKKFKVTRDHKIHELEVSSACSPEHDVDNHAGKAEKAFSQMSIGKRTVPTSETSDGTDARRTVRSLKKDYLDDIMKCTVTSSSKVNIKLPRDKKAARITGCAFMATGNLVLCDHINFNIKLLDSEFKLSNSLDVYPHRPWDVTALDETKVVVTIPNHKIMHYIQLSSDVRIDHTVHFDRCCFGVSIASGKIYVSCHDMNRKPGEIRILDIDGTELKRVFDEVNMRHGTEYFSRRIGQPFYFAVSSDGYVLYMSNWLTHTITAQTVDNKILYEYRSRKIKGINSCSWL